MGARKRPLLAEGEGGAENKVGEGGLFLFGSIIPHLRFVFVSCANDSIGHLGLASAFLLFLPLQESSLCKRAPSLAPSFLEFICSNARNGRREFSIGVVEHLRRACAVIPLALSVYSPDFCFLFPMERTEWGAEEGNFGVEGRGGKVRVVGRDFVGFENGGGESASQTSPPTPRRHRQPNPDT